MRTCWLDDDAPVEGSHEVVPEDDHLPVEVADPVAGSQTGKAAGAAAGAAKSYFVSWV